MSTKTPAFLLCENPILSENDGRLFILHTRTPAMLVELNHFKGLTDNEIAELSKIATRDGARLDYGNEVIFFLQQWIMPEPEYAALKPQEQADKVAGIMRRMADWYKAYLIWEDSQDAAEN
jgi:hypothetical protein